MNWVGEGPEKSRPNQINTHMKLRELLEAIESPREEIKQKLEDNKELLQKQRSRMGITRVLSQLFPGVNFRKFNRESGIGAAWYTPSTKKITVNNANKLMTRKSVHNWQQFCDRMIGILTHEHIHKEQHRRRDFRTREYKVLTNLDRRAQLRTKYENLYDLYQSSDGEEKQAIKRKLVKLIRKIRKQGMSIPTFNPEYLSQKDEITAYAESIAHDLIAAYQRAGYDKETAKKGALLHLRERPKNGGYEHWLTYYRETFPIGDETMKRVIKQAVKYVEQM